jgi:2-methylcitrate dehydratase PrpD
MDVVKEEGGNSRASLIGRADKVSLLQAALINGAASHALDFDDVHEGLMGHPTVVVLPGLLALGEDRRCSGKDLITAFVAGFETACHVGLCQTRRHPVRGWHPTATIGHFGAAAACANLLNLDVEKTIYALGIAGTQAAGLRQVFGTMCKPFHAGKTSTNGLLGALLAEKGFNCSSAIVEGDYGFSKTFTPDGNLSYALEGLGDDYQILKVMFKRYASCFGTHPTIDAALAFRNEGVGADDIESVHVVPYHVLYDVIKIMKPTTGLEGKFSIPYTFAVAFVKGKAGEDSFTDSCLMDPGVIQVRDKVTMEKDENMPVNNSLVVLKTRDGRTLKKHVDVSKAMKNQEEKSEAVKMKFYECAGIVLSKNDVEALYQGVMTIDEAKDVTDVVRLTQPIL